MVLCICFSCTCFYGRRKALSGSSRLQMLLEIGVLKNFANFTENTSVGVSF